MDQALPFFGAYFWWILAAVLLIGELMQPGFFLIWIAGAAAVTGLVHFIHPMEWTTEVIIFALLAAALVALTWRVVSKSWQATSDQPLLNQRQQALIGRSLPLLQPIVGGRGKVKFDDALWDVEGPDLPQGAMVKVIGLDGLRLRVEKA